MDNFLSYVFNITGKISVDDLHQHLSEKLTLGTQEKEEKNEEQMDITPSDSTTTTTSTTSTMSIDSQSPEALFRVPLQDPSISGRIGPYRVCLDKKTSVGAAVLSKDGLEMESHSNFTSIRANVCVFKGKWMYEVTLGTAGIQQLGWAPLECLFTNEEGVGDSPDSFAYDGKRVKKWNQACSNYGQAWSAGDVIACCIDLERGEISFYRNGVSLGTAFTNVRHGDNAPGLAYFPALSISHGERCIVNFGERPFEYPIKEFSPLQYAPPSSTLQHSEFLVESLNRLISFKESEKIESYEQDIVAAILFQHLAPLLENEYILIHSFYPLLQKLIGENNEALVLKVFDLMMTFMEDHEKEVSFGYLFKYLGYKCVITPYSTYLESKVPQFAALHLVLTALKTPALMELFLQLSSFKAILESIYSIKQSSVDDLNALFPVVWWPNTEEEICSKEKMEESFARVSKLYYTNEELLYELSQLFITNTKPLSSSTAYPLRIFMDWLRHIVEKNKGANRNIQPPGLSDHSVTTNLYFILLRILGQFFSSSPALFPKEIFYNDQLNYFDFTRIGGLIGHLKKTMPIEGSTQPVNLPIEVELFDDMVMLYHLAMSSRFKESSILHQSQIQTIGLLEEANKRMKRAKEQHAERDFSHERNLFRRDAVEISRQCAWYRLVLFTQWKQDGMFAAIKYLVSLLDHLNQYDPLFSYIPEFYLETLVDSFHALRRGDPPLPLTEEPYLKGLMQVITFLINHFSDKRIINPGISIVSEYSLMIIDVRDLLLQSISVLLQYPPFVRVFERDEIPKETLMKSMLLSFDQKFWIPITNIILRFWRGTGFGQPNTGTECASAVYRAVFKETCQKDISLLSEFLNRIFNHLNWAVSEFDVAAKEFLSILSKKFATDHQQYHRKCNVMFELSVSLTRVLELIALEVPQAFLEQPINLTRLSELLLFVLNRTTTGTDSKTMENLLKLELPAMDKITRFIILSPIVGTIINLYAHEDESHPLVKSIVSTGGFSIDIFKYLCAFDWKKHITDDPALDSKLEKLNQFTQELEKQLSKEEEKEAELKSSPSSEFCPICFAAVIDTKFVPCGHRSCNMCIKRHMLNSNKCFYCSAEIKSLQLETEEKK